MGWEDSEWGTVREPVQEGGFAAVALAAGEPVVFEVLAEIGVSHSGKSKSIDELPTKDFDIVVTVCDSVTEECPVWPGRAGRRIHHGFVDPAKATGTLDERKQVFRGVRDAMLGVIPKILNGEIQ